jgi:hypothetical protein
MLLAVVEFISDLPLMDKENQKQCAEGLRLKEELDYLLSPEYTHHDIDTDIVTSAENKCNIFSTCHSCVSVDSETDCSEKDVQVDAGAGAGARAGSDSAFTYTRTKVLSREHVLLLPSLPTPAPFHSESILRVFDTSNTAFFNVMQLPVTAVPLGLSRPRNSGASADSTGNGVSGNMRAGASQRNGAGISGGSNGRRQTRGPQRRGQLLSGACNLPVGMQIVGGPHRDHVSILSIFTSLINYTCITCILF